MFVPRMQPFKRTRFSTVGWEGQILNISSRITALSGETSEFSKNPASTKLQLAVAVSDHLAPIHAQARQAFAVEESRLAAALIERGLALEQPI